MKSSAQLTLIGMSAWLSAIASSCVSTEATCEDTLTCTKGGTEAGGSPSGGQGGENVTSGGASSTGGSATSGGSGGSHASGGSSSTSGGSAAAGGAEGGLGGAAPPPRNGSCSGPETVWKLGPETCGGGPR